MPVKNSIRWWVTCWLLLALSFSFNLFQVANPQMFKGFQQDSQALVERGVSLYLTKEQAIPRLILLDSNQNPNWYKSQIGLQAGLVYPAYSDALGFKLAEVVSAGLTALCICLMSWLLGGAGYSLLGYCLFGAAFLSPWLTAIARNLYWVPWSWYLPVIFSFLAVRANTTKMLCFYFFLVGASIALKSAMGYEYLSAICLMTVLPWLLVKPNQGINRGVSLIALGLVCILGFCVVLSIHGILREGSVSEGISAIYQQDVLRRTFSSASEFDPVYSKSLTSTIGEVLILYSITGYETGILRGIPWIFGMPLLYAGVILAVAISYIHKLSNRNEYAILAIFGLLVPYSWVVLAKAHSYIHVHINFVLFYLISIPIWVWVLVDSGFALKRRIS